MLYKCPQKSYTITQPHLKYKQEKEKSGLRSTGWYSIHNPQNP